MNCREDESSAGRRPRPRVATRRVCAPAAPCLCTIVLIYLGARNFAGSVTREIASSSNSPAHINALRTVLRTFACCMQVWDVKIPDKDVHDFTEDDIGEHGDVEHLRDAMEDLLLFPTTLAANELCWMTVCVYMCPLDTVACTLKRGVLYTCMLTLNTDACRIGPRTNRCRCPLAPSDSISGWSPGPFLWYVGCMSLC
jgi:hypothetical protein